MPEPRAVAPGNRELLHAVRGVGAGQAGVVARSQLLTCGVSNAAIGRAVRSGRLYRLHPGVYSLPAPELLTDHARLVAAILAAGDQAILSHGTAAWRWQIIRARPERIELSVPHRRAPLQGVTLFRPAALRPGDVIVAGELEEDRELGRLRRGLRITSGCPAPCSTWPFATTSGRW